jgi:hypothetical protein
LCLVLLIHLLLLVVLILPLDKPLGITYHL